MKRVRFFLACLAFLVLLPGAAVQARGQYEIEFLMTTDVHGTIFPYDFINDRPFTSSQASVASYLKTARATPGKAVVLLDNGDILQGQPTVYYYNFENTKAPHIVSAVMNDLGYDAGTMGNHDIEAGHPVYDRLVSEFQFPWMAANAVKADGTPYFKPYTVVERFGLKIAVIGMITPWIPNWLPQQFWTGMKFEDMVKTAQKWIPIVKEREKPDLIVGLFHAGVDFTYGGAKADTPNNENASELVATRVAGFDLIFTGHDHIATNKTVKDPDGKTVYIVGAQNGGRSMASVKVGFSYDAAEGKWAAKTVTPTVVDLSKVPADPVFLQKFQAQYDEVKAYVSRPIGKMAGSITTRDSMFGDSAFVDLVHNIQLEIAGKPEFGLNKAQISFAAPLTSDASLPTSKDGTLYVRDMFNLYKYENFLYTMDMTGKQVLDFLEYSYKGWMNTMKSDADHMINFQKDASGALVLDAKSKLPNRTARDYNYDSAAGIVYTVDLSKPAGSRVAVKSMADGTPFDPARTYSVAINSYRAQGGGGHLVTGAGFNDADVKAMKFVTSSTIKDLRYYLLKWIEGLNGKVMEPKPNGNWKVIPEDWAAKAKALDMPLYYGK